jgi:hypothetical protein
MTIMHTACLFTSLTHQHDRLQHTQHPDTHPAPFPPCFPASSQPVPAPFDFESYELIVVGSGNGACAFLSKYLQATKGQEHRRVLVLEEGQDFLRTSNVSHQANWTRSYGEESIFKLHAATTGPNARNRPIISGRAVTQGEYSSRQCLGQPVYVSCCIPRHGNSIWRRLAVHGRLRCNVEELGCRRMVERDLQKQAFCSWLAAARTCSGMGHFPAPAPVAVRANTQKMVCVQVVAGPSTTR